MNYYNENDPKAAAWLRELITWGQIPDGEVDDRSIEDVTPSDVRAFTQCHFFAGIGGWPLALRLAGWPDDRPVWTGSCPCQPFSAAGKGAGFADERHLWPAWHWLIRQSRPRRIFGEQVAKRAGLAWLDLVFADLEVENYACGAAIIPAAGVGAPHQRDRIYWMADSSSTGLEVRSVEQARRQQPAVERSGEAGGMGDASGARGGWNARGILGSEGSIERSLRGQLDQPFTTSWSSVEWVHCRDGKARPIEPGTFPLAHGVPGRVGLLRGYGNAILPQVGAAFIKASA